uniref:N-acetyltransferase domain-containing protein n=1 Tax=Babesia bovis TaxID=5865 RepID=S6BHP1_BABBO|nr:hypothetical protein [Babesia bovis]
MSIAESLSQEFSEKLSIRSVHSKSEEADSREEYVQSRINRAIHIHDLTKHTIRQAWIFLNNATKYDFNDHKQEGCEFPEATAYYKDAKFSSIVYLYNFSVGICLCDVVKYDWTGQPKKGVGKSNGKIKPEPFAVVILCIAVLPTYRGVNLSKKLYDHTMNKAIEARFHKIFALADAETEGFYNKLGFTKTDYEPLDQSELKVKLNGTPCQFSVMEYTINQGQ